MVRITHSRVKGGSSAPQDAPPVGPAGVRRSEVFRRLQMGGIGIVGVLVLIALASFIEERAKISDRSAVPQASVASGATSSIAAPDPLAQAGVVPDIPATPTDQSGRAGGTQTPSPPR